MAPPARPHASAVKHVNSGEQVLSVEPTSQTYDAKILQIGQLSMNPKTNPALRHIWDYYYLS